MTTNAPKRIWANCTTPLATRKSGTWTEDPYGQLFIRADLSPSPEVVKELVEALESLLEAITAENRHGDRSLTITGPTANLKWLLEAQEDARTALAKLEGGE